ncbi:MAG: DNA-binding protein, partial [Eggerthellaceae bacterium]|nr:DNA-binding protein [Eggerthellaceae bacterium]
MARGVTQDQVTKAADALLARGERPTIEKVRAVLGIGSPNTLLRLLEVWWSELAGRLAAQARAELPDIPEAVQRAMMTLWSEAVVATRQESEARYEESERGLQERE